MDRLDLDPAELAEAADRLTLLNRLCDKYGGIAGTLDEVLAYRARVGGQIDELKKQDEDCTSIADEIAGLEKQLQDIGARLTMARKKAAAAWFVRVHAQLADLGMKEAKFHVEFTSGHGTSSGRKGTQAQRH